MQLALTHGCGDAVAKSIRFIVDRFAGFSPPARTNGIRYGFDLTSEVDLFWHVAGRIIQSRALRVDDDITVDDKDFNLSNPVIGMFGAESLHRISSGEGTVEIAPLVSQM